MNKALLFLVCCVLLSGCVIGSSNAFYTPELVVEAPELNGPWYFDESTKVEEESPLVVSPGKFTIYDDKGVPADAKAVFFKIDGVLFVDIFPDEGQLRKELVGDRPPVHLLNRVLIKGEKISFNPLDYDWLIKAVEAGDITFPLEKFENGDVLFTASSEQWVEFLRTHKDNPLAFVPDREALLARQPPAKDAAPAP